MEKKFKTQNIGFQNVISFTCSDSSLEPLLELLSKLKSLGQMGGSREVEIDWDGDGSHRLDNISVNGITLHDWNCEWNRLNNIGNISTTSSNSNECGENEH
jgi:hypothetical protein